MLAGVVLALLVLSAVLAGRTGRWGAGLLGVAAVAWLLVNSAMEGPTIWVVTDTHGLTAGDLSGLTALLAAAVLWWRG